MSWTCSTDKVATADVAKAIDEATPIPSDPKFDGQVAAVKAVAKELARQIGSPKVNVSMSGHVHSGEDAADSVSVYLNGWNE